MSVVDEARAWIAQDPDPETRRELESLVDSRLVREVLTTIREAVRRHVDDPHHGWITSLPSQSDHGSSMTRCRLFVLANPPRLRMLRP